jgi:hypothetical protein
MINGKILGLPVSALNSRLVQNWEVNQDYSADFACITLGPGPHYSKEAPTPELRQNFMTKEWVVIAVERAKPPDHMAVKREAKPAVSFSENCPFCPRTRRVYWRSVFPLVHQRDTPAQAHGWI